MGFFYEICVPLTVVIAGAACATLINDNRGSEPA